MQCWCAALRLFRVLRYTAPQVVVCEKVWWRQCHMKFLSLYANCAQNYRINNCVGSAAQLSLSQTGFWPAKSEPRAPHAWLTGCFGGSFACLFRCLTAASEAHILAAPAYLNATINFYVYLPSQALTGSVAQPLIRYMHRRLGWSSILFCDTRWCFCNYLLYLCCLKFTTYCSNTFHFQFCCDVTKCNCYASQVCNALKCRKVRRSTWTKIHTATSKDTCISLY